MCQSHFCEDFAISVYDHHYVTLWWVHFNHLLMCNLQFTIFFATAVKPEWTSVRHTWSSVRTNSYQSRFFVPSPHIVEKQHSKLEVMIACIEFHLCLHCLKALGINLSFVVLCTHSGLTSCRCWGPITVITKEKTSSWGLVRWEKLRHRHDHLTAECAGGNNLG